MLFGRGVQLGLKERGNFRVVSVFSVFERQVWKWVPMAGIVRRAADLPFQAAAGRVCACVQQQGYHFFAVRGMSSRPNKRGAAGGDAAGGTAGVVQRAQGVGSAPV